MDKLVIAMRKISITYHFVRLLIKAKAPYHCFSAMLLVVNAPSFATNPNLQLHSAPL